MSLPDDDLDRATLPIYRQGMTDDPELKAWCDLHALRELGLLPAAADVADWDGTAQGAGQLLESWGLVDAYEEHLRAGAGVAYRDNGVDGVLVTPLVDHGRLADQARVDSRLLGL